MNTDNMSISGETIDYGPCAFLEAYDPEMVFSSIDLQGRYAYSNQPAAAHWNLTRLAESLLPLLAEEEGSQEAALVSARAALDAFGPQFEAARYAGLRRKLGLFTEARRRRRPRRRPAGAHGSRPRRLYPHLSHPVQRRRGPRGRS